MGGGNELARAQMTDEVFCDSLAWRYSSALLILAMAVLLNACGGGGGGGGSAPQASATTATLSWDAVTDSNLGGYRIYLGTAPGNYTEFESVIKGVTSFTVEGLKRGTRYYFAVTAYDDASNNESFPANEVFKDIP